MAERKPGETYEVWWWEYDCPIRKRKLRSAFKMDEETANRQLGASARKVAGSGEVRTQGDPAVGPGVMSKFLGGDRG